MVMTVSNRVFPAVSSTPTTVTTNSMVSTRGSTFLHDLDGLERRYRNLVDINRHFVEWKCRFGQLEQRVALYRAWDVLPESLQRSVASPPQLLSTLKQITLEENDEVLAEAWKALENYVDGSWRRLKQCVDATIQDIRRRELSAEIELRIIQVQCSPPVMWIAPSILISLPDTVVIDGNQSYETGFTTTDSCFTIAMKTKKISNALTWNE